MVVVTTPNSATVSAEHRVRVLPIGVFSHREALTYLMGRLTADPDQRIGAIALVQDIGSAPLALAQAGVVIASSALSCRDYRDYFVRRREQWAEAGGGEPPAAAVTWTFSVEQADRLAPGGGAQSVLALAALLDGHGIPGAIFASSAACEYLARDGARGRGDRERAWGALLTLERAGLLTIDRATTPPTVRINSVLQAAIRAAMPEGMLDRAVRAAADALLEVWPADEQGAWVAAGLRSCAARLQRAAGGPLGGGGR